MTAKPVTELDLPWIDFSGERYATEPLAVLQEAREKFWIANSIRGLQVLTHDAVGARLEQKLGEHQSRR